MTKLSNEYSALFDRGAKELRSARLSSWDEGFSAWHCTRDLPVFWARMRFIDTGFRICLGDVT